MKEQFWVAYSRTFDGGEEVYLDTTKAEALQTAEDWAKDVMFSDGDEGVEIVVARVVPAAVVTRKVEHRVTELGVSAS